MICATGDSYRGAMHPDAPPRRAQTPKPPAPPAPAPPAAPGWLEAPCQLIDRYKPASLVHPSSRGPHLAPGGLVWVSKASPSLS